MKNKIDLPNFRKEEIERMEEIKFFLFISKISKVARLNGLEDEMELLTPLIKLTGANEDIIELAKNTIIGVNCRPLDIEVSITARAGGLPYNIVENQLMHSKKHYSLSAQYLEERKNAIMTPRLTEDILKEIIKFNSVMQKKIYPVFRLMGMEFEQEEKERWDS